MPSKLITFLSALEGFFLKSVFLGTQALIYWTELYGKKIVAVLIYFLGINIVS